MTLAYAPAVHARSQQWYRPIASPKIGWLPSALIFAIVFISFRPFASQVAATPGQASGGDIVNQIGFGLMGLICIFLLLKHVPANARSALITPSWFLVGIVLLISVLSADNPSGAMRAMAFSVIVVLAAATALAVPRNMAEMVSALSWSSIAALLMCYIAVIFVPEQGVHSGGGFEAQHAGLWRGVYAHKNVASYVMGGFAIIGLFVARNGKLKLGLAIFVFSILFVLQAGSKTVLGVLPAALATAALARWVTWGFLRAIIVFIPVVALMAATLGAVMFLPILEELRTYIPGLSYTGRTDLWIFGLEFLQKSPWFGYGFESFWNTPRVVNMEQPIELSWDVRGIVHGHNSWLDATISFGMPGGIFICFALTILAVRDYLRIPQTGNAARLASLFITLWIFTALGANLESFFFRRSDPVWFCMLIAVIGLRLTAHMSTHQTSAAIHR